MNTPFEYPCHAFHDSFTGGKTSGEFTLSSQGIHFVLGDMNGSLPLANLKVYLGGANNRIIFIDHPLRPDLRLFLSDLRFLKNPILLAHPECCAQINQARQQRRSGWAVFGFIALLILSLPILFLFQMDRVSGAIVKSIPTEWEATLGKGVTAQFSLTHTLMAKEQSNALLKPLTTPLLTALPNTPYTYDLTIVNDASLNAFALPGGFITLNSGLILRAESAEELLGVIAHEISHVEERHGVRSIIKNMSVFLLASTFLGDIQGVLATIANAAPMLLSQEYSRGFEADADEKAVTLLRRAQINPIGLPQFFEKMIAEEKKTLDKIDNEDARTAYKKLSTLLSTHPTNETRMQRLNALIQNQSGEYKNLATDFVQLQNAVKKFVTDSSQQLPEQSPKQKPQDSSQQIPKESPQDSSQKGEPL